MKAFKEFGVVNGKIGEVKTNATIGRDIHPHRVLQPHDNAVDDGVRELFDRAVVAGHKVKIVQCGQGDPLTMQEGEVLPQIIRVVHKDSPMI